MQPNDRTAQRKAGIDLKLRSLVVNNFRGIKYLDWRLDASFVSLVGSGDSTKTTVLDALGLVLSSRYNVTFTDADFFACNIDSPIVIEAVVVDLPNELVAESSHGKHRSGIRSEGRLEHDPVDGSEECLIIRLTVDKTLEPVWEVVRPGEAEGAKISATQRQKLGFFRIGDYADAHLRWSRGSALSSLTSSKTPSTHAVVEAQRQARKAVSELKGTALHKAAAITQREATKLGSAVFSDLRPGMDPALGGTSASLVLHDGNIPLTQFGLGSRRLTSLAIQENAISGGSMVAIDEVEHGLDPHRLLHLMRYLRNRAEKGELQVFLTTHSPLVVESLETRDLFVVRSEQGETTVTSVPESLTETDLDVTQGLMRERPSALLARQVIVGEGATETGFLRMLLAKWDAERENPEDLTAVTAGVAVTNGGGDSKAPDRAKSIATLGYPTMLVLDGDVITNAERVQAAQAAGVEVVQWPQGSALEDVIVSSLSLTALQDLVELAVDETSEEGVRAQVASQLAVPSLPDLKVSGWVEAHGEEHVREAIARAAQGQKANGTKEQKRSWFKREDRGERLASLVLDSWSDVTTKELGRGLLRVREFAYRRASQGAVTNIQDKDVQ